MGGNEVSFPCYNHVSAHASLARCRVGNLELEAHQEQLVSASCDLFTETFVCLCLEILDSSSVWTQPRASFISFHDLIYYGIQATVSETVLVLTIFSPC